MRRASKVCATRGCPNLTRSRLCPECAKDQRSYDDHRPTSTQRGYDAEWRKARDKHLEENPYCVDCGRLATEVDHHIPLENGGTSDDSNLRSRCKSCHSKKTAQFDGGFGNKKIKGGSKSLVKK